MATFNCSPYDRGKLVRVLEYAIEKKHEDRVNGLINDKMYLYDLKMMKELIKMLNGKSKYEGYLGMSREGREKYATGKPPKKEDDGFWKN